MNKKPFGFALKAIAKVIQLWGMYLVGETTIEAAQRGSVAGAAELMTALAPLALGFALDWLGSWIKSKRTISEIAH